VTNQTNYRVDICFKNLFLGEMWLILYVWALDIVLSYNFKHIPPLMFRMHTSNWSNTRQLVWLITDHSCLSMKRFGSVCQSRNVYPVKSLTAFFQIQIQFSLIIAQRVGSKILSNRPSNIMENMSNYIGQPKNIRKFFRISNR